MSYNQSQDIELSEQVNLAQFDAFWRLPNNPLSNSAGLADRWMAFMLTEIRAAWLKHLLSTEPSDRQRAEASLSALYPEILQRPAPQYFFWFDSPQRAGWAVKLLESAHERLWQAFVEEKSSRREGRLFIEGLRAELCQKSGMEWDQLTKIAGMNRTQQSPFNRQRITLHRLDDLFRTAYRDDHPQNREFKSRVMPLLAGPDMDDELTRIEERYHKAILHSCGVGLSLRHNQQSPYTLAKMADDEAAVVSNGLDVPPAIAAAWELARSAGHCWPFQGAVVLLERPAVLRFNSEMGLHSEDGPAGGFRDGTQIWALNGMASNEEFILHPENIRPALWKELHPNAVARIKKARAAKGMAEPLVPGKVTLKGSVAKAYSAFIRTFAKRTGVFEKDLPVAIEERIGALREYNGGSLPLLDRYLAGEHEAVWRDLVALDAAVRENPNAADALAVAYETMSRVEANVRMVSSRLTEVGFTKSDGPLHVPPDHEVDTKIRQLEKAAGTLPLSLRAFYQVVGSVDWIGKHASLSAAKSPLCTDPLVVEPIERVLEASDYFGDGKEKWIVIAPDALMKAETSGGDPYVIEVPNTAADGILRFEEHGLYFVEYLRLVFRFGGFPGYEGIEQQPPELATLSADLRAF